MNPIELLIRTFGLDEHKAKAIIDSGFVVETTITDNKVFMSGKTITIANDPVSILYCNNTSYFTNTAHLQYIDVTSAILNLVSKI